MPTPAPPPPPASPPETPRGPGVALASPSLVRRSRAGAIERLEVDPAEAALDLVDIDDGARQRALAILDKRASAIDRVVRRQLDSFTGGDAGTPALSHLQLASRLHAEFEREIGAESLVDQLAGVLPRDRAQTLRCLVEEYWEALVRDEGGDGVGRIEDFVIRRRAALGLFAHEIARSLERLAAFHDRAGASALERILRELELDPHQEREIRAMARDFSLGAQGPPSAQEQADFLTRVYLRFDPERRTRFFRLIVASPE